MVGPHTFSSLALFAKSLDTPELGRDKLLKRETYEGVFTTGLAPEAHCTSGLPWAPYWFVCPNLSLWVVELLCNERCESKFSFIGTILQHLLLTPCTVPVI